MALWSRPDVPAEVLAEMGVSRGERVLAAGTMADGSWVVATDRHLVLPVHGSYRLVPWPSIDRAGWDRDSEVLVVVESAPLGSRPHRHALRVDQRGRLADVVREQVNATVVISRKVPIVGDRGVRIVGRRRPDELGLAWTVAVDHGIDVDDPEIRARVDAELAEARSEVGE